ncbi:MAG: hypothetical protein JKY37_02150 [Nannocystaceae bacterium]|nr:hypothetical protein [Nannocystaceae bacterium]
MKRQHRNYLGLTTLGLTLGLGGATLQGCEADGLAGDLAEQCGLDVNCTAGGFAEGKSSISGIASIDAFFGAAIDLNAAMVGLSGALRADLDAIGASVGLESGSTGAELKGAMQGHLAGYIDGGLTIDYQPPRCQASVEASVSAAAECDVDVDPGEVSAKCSGSCEAEAGVAASCSGDAELKCSGTAPGFDCSTGVCSGSCVAEFTAGDECKGTCRGTCDGEGGPNGFEGRCDGDCEGVCAVDMSAGGECEFSCQGSCEYTAPDGGCEATASASCEAKAGAAIECDARCEGTVEPPSVSAECEATVDAKASASVTCTPPTLAFKFEWSAEVAGDLNAQAEFRAWLEGFRGHFAGLLAARVEAELIGDAAVALVASAEGALRGTIEDLSTSGDLKATVGAKCALGELPLAASALADASGSLSANLSATVEVVSAF